MNAPATDFLFATLMKDFPALEACDEADTLALAQLLLERLEHKPSASHDSRLAAALMRDVVELLETAS